MLGNSPSQQLPTRTYESRIRTHDALFLFLAQPYTKIHIPSSRVVNPYIPMASFLLALFLFASGRHPAAGGIDLFGFGVALEVIGICSSILTHVPQTVR